MPKVSKKIRSSELDRKSTRHEPLGQTIQADHDRDKYAVSSGRIKQKKVKKHFARNNNNENFEREEEYMDEKTSKRILELTKQQQFEIQQEEEKEERRRRTKHNKNNNKTSTAKAVVDSSDEEEDDDHEEEDQSIMLDDDDDDDEEEMVQRDNDGYVTVVDDGKNYGGLTADEEAVVESMIGNGGGSNSNNTKRSLTDLILEKIQEKEAEKRGEQMQDDDGDNNDEQHIDLPPKVIEVYTEIGKVLSRYTSGKLPKAFKVIPSLSNWEEILYLTRPDLWTPHAMYEATRIFASNLNPKMAQRFYNLVLLDAVRADIVSNKKLNYHYYLSLKKAIYKPAAFFKGILLPLCKDDSNCTLREATIIASVLQRVSIPVQHSAVALHKLALLTNYSGTSSIFIKTLLNKKYSLPAPVVKSLIQHFTSFVDKDTNQQQLPVLWHQALLVFVQRYKNEILSVSNAKESIRRLCQVHYHDKITPEIRRELFGLQAYKDERAALGLVPSLKGSTSYSVGTSSDGDKMEIVQTKSKD